MTDDVARDARGGGRGSAPVLRSAIRRLRQLSLAAEEGDFLGTEADLQGCLGISRPTLRQAVRIVEQDQMVKKRMGPRGGCYASRPSLALVARAAALYLQGRKTGLLDLLDVSHALLEQAQAKAARSGDAAARADLAEFLAGLDPAATAADLPVFLDHERRFEELILALAGNPALDLVVQITRKFVDDTTASQAFIADPAMRLRRAQGRLSRGRAILDGDAAACLAVSRAQSEAFRALIPARARAVAVPVSVD